MQTQAFVIKTAQPVGFVIPKQLAEFPLVVRRGTLLSLEQEQAFGFTVLQLTLDQIQAMACDRKVVESLLSEIEAGFTGNDKAEKAVSMVKVNGVWIRHGSVEDKAFTALARERIARARNCLNAMSALNAQERDLFYINVLDALREALSDLLPYDMIVSKAMTAFRERCSDLADACRDLVKFVAKEMYLTRPCAQQVCEQFWLSNKLPAICFGSNRYIQAIMPTKAKRDFRFGVLERQQRIAKIALASGVPVSELLWSWSVFNKQFQRSDRLASTFAKFNEGLAEKVAREYRFADDFDQVRSAANQGLSRAISLYAPERGGKFSTYAVTWIKQTIIRDLIKQGLIRLPEGSHTMLGRVRAIYADLPHASDEYVCKAANISAFELEGLRPYLQGTAAMSMDSLPNSDGEDTGLHAYIADENNDFVSDLEEQSDLEYIVSLLKDALNEQEFHVIAHRTGLGGAVVIPVAEMAVQLGTSPQNISRMVKKALTKLESVPGLRELWEELPGV
jgi:RNA polymerase sigma factor (sigma-70 family)